jgi:Golgi phosphoprotein 3
MLSISEELFLLALDEEKGNILPSVKRNLAYGLSGAALSELALMGKVCSNEKHRLDLVDASTTGDEFLDGAIREIQSSEKPRKLAYWVSQLSVRPKKLRERTGERLVAKDVLYQEDRRFFWKQPYSAGGQPVVPSKFELKNDLRAMILSTGEADHRSLALLSAASASELLNLIFTQDEVPVAKRRIQEKVTRAALESPAMQTIEEIEQAVESSLEDDED